MDCEAASGDNIVLLYDGVCPNAASQLVNVQWNNFVSFDISVFRLQSATMLTFTCTVAVYPDANDMPTACIKERRERRELQTESINKVSVTLNIGDDDDSYTTAVGVSCASFHNFQQVVFTLFFTLLYVF